MAIQDDISNFFDRMMDSARYNRGMDDIAIESLQRMDPYQRTLLEGDYNQEQYSTLEEAIRMDPNLRDRVLEIMAEQEIDQELTPVGPEIEIATDRGTAAAMPRPRPAVPTVPTPSPRPQTAPREMEGLSDAEMMQFEPVPYARANEIQTLIDQAAVMQGGPNRGGVSTAGLADDEMIAGFNPAQRAAYARMVRDMVGASGAVNMRPEGAEPRDALTSSAIQAVIDRERGADRGRVANQATAEDEQRALEFGALASTGAGNALKGGIKGAQAVQRAGGLRALLNRIGLGNLAKARQTTAQTQYPIGVGTRFGAARPQMMRDPATGRMLSARDIGPQPLPYGPQMPMTIKTPGQIRTQMLLDAARRAPGGYAGGGRMRDGIMGVYDRM